MNGDRFGKGAAPDVAKRRRTYLQVGQPMRSRKDRRSDGE